MADIKGITIEFRGETTELSKALNTIKKESEGLASDIKAVNRALKFNPTNVELIRQKFNLLGQKVDQTKKELDAYRAAEAKLRKDKVSEQSAEWMTVRRKIIEAESQLRHYNAEMQKIKYARLSALGAGATAAGNKMRGLSMAVGLVGGMAVRTTAEFDSAMSKVRAVSGATGQDFMDLRNKAREMGATTKFSATESAEAFNYMAMAGWNTQQMIDGIPGVLNLAAASGEDLATTSDIVTDGLTAMGYAASDAGRMADVMAAASSNANTNVAMMGETFKYAAPVAGSLGYSMEDVALATGLMANSGIKASQAGTSLRSMMSRMAAPTDAVSGAMERLGISLTDENGEMKSLRQVMTELRSSMANLSETEKTEVASTIAGKNAMSGFLAIVNSSDKDFNKLANAIDNSNGAAQEMADAMIDNLGGQLTILKSGLQELAIAMGDTLVPIVQKMVKGVQAIVNWFNSLSPRVQQIITVMVALAGAAGPVLIVFGAMASGFGQFMGVVGKIPMLLSKLGGALTVLMSPVGIVIAAVAALALAFKHLWDTNEEFRKAITTIWQTISQTIGAFIEGIKNSFASFGTDFGSLITTLKAAWEAFCAVLAPVFQTAFTLVSTVLQTVTDVILGILDVFIGLFTGNWKQMLSGITRIFSATFRGVFNTAKTIFSGVRKVASNLAGALSGIWSRIRGTASATWGAIKNAIVHPIETAKNLIKGIIEKIKGFFSFSISPPHIPLPHFAISPPGWKLSDLLKGRKPTLGIDWYASGGIFKRPTVAGLGDVRGGEAAVPLADFYNHLDALGDSIVNGVARLQMAGAASQPVVIPVYLFPGSAKMDEIVVNAYDRGKRRIG